MSENTSTPKQGNQNARRHGLTSNIVLAHQLNDFNTLRNELLAQCKPEGVIETTAFERVLTARWNMFRAQEAEAALLFECAEDQDPLTDPKTRQLADLFSRYYTRFEGSYNRALKQLKDFQTNRAIETLKTNPETDQRTLPPLTELQKIQRFAKRTPPKKVGLTEEEMLAGFAEADRQEIKKMARNVGCPVPVLLLRMARFAWKNNTPKAA
ncbi:MAG: hypothetical protein IT168_01895 [Bryobacterales bacterium]|nr:hypothetical protein [Bryobacterales bacterium]